MNCSVKWRRDWHNNCELLCRRIDCAEHPQQARCPPSASSTSRRTPSVMIFWGWGAVVRRENAAAVVKVWGASSAPALERARESAGGRRGCRRRLCCCCWWLCSSPQIGPRPASFRNESVVTPYIRSPRRPRRAPRRPSPFHREKQVSAFSVCKKRPGTST